MDASASSSRSSGGGAAETYVGSLISLTSKSEIRYEGILYNINTDESSIGLRNVRSFGTEGRKKDGPQIPPSDKVYEYILFRGSDIKDLQVKSSPPIQTTPPLSNDPAIIQSHYPYPASTATSLSSASSRPLTDINSHPGQPGLTGPNIQSGPALYQPGGSLGSWGSSPSPNANGSGLAMPMYWQGYYNPPNGVTHMHPQPLLTPPSGSSMSSSSQQPIQYPDYNASVPTGFSNLTNLNPSPVPAPLLPGNTSPLNMMSTVSPPKYESSSMLSNLPQARYATLPGSTPNLASSSSFPIGSLGTSLQSLASLTTSPELNPVAPPMPNQSNAIVDQSRPYQNFTYSSSSTAVSIPVHSETPTPSLITPGQLMQSGSKPIAFSQPLQMAHKDGEVVQVSSSSSEARAPVATESQPPILPLPVPSRVAQRANGAPFQNRYGYRGRERGRGSGSFRQVTKFTEDFDFEAMNEKFKKDEVWGHLGKSSKMNGEETDEEDSQEQYDTELQKLETKPVYNKDDFFDMLSCNALDRDSQNGRTRFSEQLKIDTETFGDFVRHRGGRGGRWHGRGGRYHGGYYGNYGRGYGYGYGGRGGGRSGGRGMSGRAP